MLRANEFGVPTNAASRDLFKNVILNPKIIILGHV
jgi:hypothetical protein